MRDQTEPVNMLAPIANVALMLELVQTVKNRPPFLPGIGVFIANGLASLLAARLSRTDEYEADAYAAALLTKAGIGVAPQKSLFGKLEDLTRSRAGAVPAWLMSHPKTSERIKALEVLETRWDQG